MRINRTKQILSQGKTAVGISHSQLRTPDVERMMAAAGMDWVFIDTEHGGMSIETIQDLVQFTLQTPMTPVVRVADFQYDLVARVLDVGAEGVIFPRCEDPALLAKAVSWTKFPTQGIRGFGLTPPAVGFSTAPFPRSLRPPERANSGRCPNRNREGPRMPRGTGQRRGA